MKTLPPIGKQKRYAPQTLVYIHALEVDPPSNRDPIDWKLVTNLPVDDLAAAVEKLDWYALRWKVEVFHKIMKSGCRAEDARLQTAERLVKLLALISVVSWRIFWITMSARAQPDARPETVLTPAEIETLDRIDAARSKPRILRGTLATYLLQIAMLGGYLARTRDHPPGNIVVWRGLTKLQDVAFGIAIGSPRRCGQLKASSGGYHQHQRSLRSISSSVLATTISATLTVPFLPTLLFRKWAVLIISPSMYLHRRARAAWFRTSRVTTFISRLHEPGLAFG